MGKYTRVKIEPVVPTANGIEGQNREELDEIVRRSAESGVRTIISKTMRLNHSVPPQMRERLVEYYKENGVNEGTTLALSESLRRELITPVLDACEKYGIAFCPCVDSDSIGGESCRLWVPSYKEA